MAKYTIEMALNDIFQVVSDNYVHGRLRPGWREGMTQILRSLLETNSAPTATNNDLAKVVFENNVAKGWWDERNRNIGEILMLINSELTEALEEWRVAGDLVLEMGYNGGKTFTDGPTKPKWHGYHFEDNGKPVGFWSEIADTFIRLMDLCGRYNVDIDTIIVEKIEFNKTRPHRHGKKHA